MCLKLDNWSCNLHAFDRETNVLLCKDDSPRPEWLFRIITKVKQMINKSQSLIRSRFPEVWGVNGDLRCRLMLRSWKSGGKGCLRNLEKLFFLPLLLAQSFQVLNLISLSWVGSLVITKGAITEKNGSCALSIWLLVSIYHLGYHCIGWVMCAIY